MCNQKGVFVQTIIYASTLQVSIFTPHKSSNYINNITFKNLGKNIFTMVITQMVIS